MKVKADSNEPPYYRIGILIFYKDPMTSITHIL